jgi:hypothetical protein
MTMHPDPHAPRKPRNRAGVIKQDAHAHRHWGDAYDAIPKSVFATVAWHLANAMSGECDADGAAERAFLAELAALVESGLIPAPQATRARAALAKSQECAA